MQLLVIRHAIAEDKDAFAATGEDDSRRPLTERGAEKMAEVAAGLRSIVPAIDVLAASPFVRAQQTAAIVAAACGGLEVETTDVLVPESSFPAFRRWLNALKKTDVVAIVGHEPHLGALVTRLMTGDAAGGSSRIELKKGGACLLEISAGDDTGGATLQWLLTPSQLRRLGR
jgi:phosphohistidine phosphatase